MDLDSSQWHAWDDSYKIKQVKFSLEIRKEKEKSKWPVGKEGD